MSDTDDTDARNREGDEMVTDCFDHSGRFAIGKLVSIGVGSSVSTAPT